MVDHFYTENDATVAQMQNYLQSNLDTLTSDFALPWVNVLSNLFIILLSAGVLFSLNWSFVLLTAIFVLIDLNLPKIMARMTSEASRKVMQNTSAFLTGIGEWINGLNELRRYHAWTILNKELSSYAKKLEKSKVNQTNKNCASNTINGIGNTLGQMSIAFLAGILFLTGQIKIGAALASTSFAFG
ncbi:MAG: ABC transporter transmembrane domain-containing protein, partial [Lactobacillus sp.]|nr:ABC transporter transmembrane domain-containing protein [Lactobacillus sp.]